MYCKECGKGIDNNSKYCSYCGTKQSDASTLIENLESASNLNPVTQNLNVSLSFGKPSETKSTQKKVITEKYDKSYEGDRQASIFGIIIMAISLIIYLTVKVENETDLVIYKSFAAIINIINRIVATIWVVNIAKRQNRSPEGWGIFAFFIPNLALVIIGFSRKFLRLSTKSSNSDYIDNLSQEESSYDYDSYNKISHKIKEINRIKSFLGGDQDILTIEFSDSKAGKVYYSYYSDEFSILSYPGNLYIHYNSKDSAIEGLHYYLSTKKILKKGRATW